MLADSWALYGKSQTRGIEGIEGILTGSSANTQSPLWRQVNRMFFIHERVRLVAQRHLVAFKGFMDAAVIGVAKSSQAATGFTSPPIADICFPSVVSKAYTNPTSGRVRLRQDDPLYWHYDTIPTMGAYLDTIKQRGPNFMGCKEPMRLGCTGSLSRDNPFGEYIVRE